MDAETMELLDYHRCLCTQLPFGSAGGNLCARHRTEGPYRSNGDSGHPHHSFGSASGLSAGFGRCRTTFARKVSWVSEKILSETVRKAPIGLDLKRQKSTKRVEKGLFRCSGGQEWRAQSSLWALFGQFLSDRSLPHTNGPSIRARQPLRPSPKSA